MVSQKFQKKDLIYEDAIRIIYRAYSTTEQTTVIIKTFKKETLSHDEDAIIKNEFSICQSLDSEGLLTPLYITKYQGITLQKLKIFLLK